MPKFMVELWLDGYEDPEEMRIACKEFMYEQLNFTGSGVTIMDIDTTKKEELLKRIQDYLLMGGLFNPELAIHDKVRDLIIDLREELNGKNQSK